MSSPIGAIQIGTAPGSSGAPLARATLDAATTERTMLLAETYRRGPVWCLCTAGQGYDHGLDALARGYGVRHRRLNDGAGCEGLCVPWLRPGGAVRARNQAEEPAGRKRRSPRWRLCKLRDLLILPHWALCGTAAKYSTPADRVSNLALSRGELSEA